MDAGMIRLLVLDAILIATAGGLLVLGRWLAIRASQIAERAAHWPTTSGVISKTQYVTTPSTEGSGAQTYLYIVCDYAIGGKKYSRNTKIYQESLFGEMQARYPAGATATVFYDPQKPKRATIDLRLLDEGKTNAILCYFGAGMALFMLAISVYVMIGR